MTQAITPSSLWQGTPHPTSRWTVQQIGALMKEGRDPISVPTATVLRRPRENPDDWTMPPKAVELVLPRLRLRHDGKRAQVITPAGAIQWMDIVHGR